MAVFTIDRSACGIGPDTTVMGALAGGAGPALVDSEPVVLITVPTVDDVIVTTIVQPPGGMLVPVAMLSELAATVTPAHVPRLPEVVVTPGGMLSVNGEESVIAVALALPSERVSVALPPTPMVAGAIVFASVGGVPPPPPPPVTVSGALAGGASPTLVASGPVVFVTVPCVDDVMVTTIVQPPTGIVVPTPMPTLVAPTVTPVHVPALVEVMVTPAGMLSMNGAVRVAGTALGLPSERVSVAAPPALMDAGTMVLPSETEVVTSVLLSLALPCAPDVVSLTVTTFTSGLAVMFAANDTGTVNVRLLPAPAGSVEPRVPKLSAPATPPVRMPQVAVPAATQFTGPLSVTPGGKMSLTETVRASETPVFVATMVYVVVPPGV